ncbi:hypothetical protein [Haloflavibacter putidus]|uniref:Uncharacterized protein n=1 Tax=Haloflavibacter putidus TaxID=2576776 RepID=A0A507ZXI9_9FLAO|nr:hypothetical protein [Haloflavibacter putidus]TQD40418.1 hypothetical protein FKR84_00110 [Haloflavibacter putidus]
MIHRKLLFFLLAGLFPVVSILAQNANNTSYIPKNSIWVGAKAGLTFYDNELARLNEATYLGQEINNSVKAEIVPQIDYALFDNFLVGAQLGFGYAYFEEDSANFSSASQNYKIGLQAAYHLPIIEQVHIFTEIGGNYNYFKTKEENSNLQLSGDNSYFKSYLDVGVSLAASKQWLFLVVFKDVLSYHSSLPNFSGKEDFEGGVVFKDFINYPHFSVKYRLE